MANIDPLLERNKHFAATNAREGAGISARPKLLGGGTPNPALTWAFTHSKPFLLATGSDQRKLSSW
jgi:hypothetical protein